MKELIDKWGEFEQHRAHVLKEFEKERAGKLKAWRESQAQKSPLERSLARSGAFNLDGESPSMHHVYEGEPSLAQFMGWLKDSN